MEQCVSFRRVMARNNKHFMTGPEGNREFCFPETLNVSRGGAEGNIEVEGKQSSLFPTGPVTKCFFKLVKNFEIVYFTPGGSYIYRGFKEHDLITCESKVHVIVSLGSY